MKSTAVTLGPAVKKYLIGFSGMMAAGLTTTGIICNQTFPYYIAVSIALAQTIHQVRNRKLW